MKKLERKKVNEIIRKYVEEGKFDDFYFDRCDYWEGVPYVNIYGEKIALAKTFYYMNASNIFTIYDYKTIRSVKQMLDTIVNSKDIIERMYISKYSELESEISIIQTIQETEKLSRKEAIDLYLEANRMDS